MVKMCEIIDAGFNIGEDCRQCIETYGHSNCCEEEEDECSQFDSVRSDYMDSLN